MSLRRATLTTVLTQPPGRNTWNKIRKHLDALTGPELNAAVQQVAAVIKGWPALISRPPLRSWRSAGDPRLTVCKIVHETATYGDYLKALAQIKLRNGWQAVQLERQFTGQAYDADGHEMTIGIPGAGDLKGGVILEWESGGRIHKIGARLEVEPKAEDGTPSQKQLQRQAAFNMRAECYVIAHSPDDAVEQVRAWKEAREREFSC